VSKSFKTQLLDLIALASQDVWNENKFGTVTAM